MSDPSQASLRRYLGGDDATTLPAEALSEARRARAFLAADGAVPRGLPAAIGQALVAVLAERRDVDRLGVLARDGDRDLSKEARRGLHLLRTRGVAAESPAPAGRAPARTAAAADPAEAWAGPPEGGGDRLVSVVQPAPGGGFDLLHFQFSDERGLVDVVSGRGSRKLWRDQRRRFEEQHLVLARVPMAYAMALVEEAYRLTLSLGRSPPPGFGPARALLAVDAAALPRLDHEHPALAEVPAAPELSRDGAAQLHELPDLRSWVAPRPALAALGLRLDEIETSKLLVDDRQRHEARRAAVDRAIEATFDEAGRRTWRRRLLDAAYVYGRAGHEDDAARLRREADRLAEPAWSCLDDPFARAFVEKVVAPELRSGVISPDGDPADAADAAKTTIVTP